MAGSARQGAEGLSFSAQLKLEWLIFYHTQGGKNAKVTASHFGITRKTLHKWLKRFNRTIQEEFVEITDVDPLFVDDFNQQLLDWLIEYNSERPHQALAYQNPLEYLDTYHSQVSPMSSSRTTP